MTLEMVEKFQCPGCVCGSDTKCGKFKQDSHGACANHVLGTFMLGVGHIALGLPKGFNKSGMELGGMRSSSHLPIRLWESGKRLVWDKLNVPVWAMEQDGYLFVRTFIPRRSMHFVDVVKGGNLAMVPKAINVAEFIDEID